MVDDQAGLPQLKELQVTRRGYYFTIKYKDVFFYMRLDRRTWEYEVWKAVPIREVRPDEAIREFESLLMGDPLALRVAVKGEALTLLEVVKRVGGEERPQLAWANAPSQTGGGVTEGFPVYDTIKQIKGKTIQRSSNYWRAVVLTEDARGRRSVRAYLWQNRNGRWKVAQKLNVNSKKSWEKLKKAVEESLKYLEQK